MYRRLAAALLCLTVLTAAKLPQTGPVPEAKPEESTPAEQVKPEPKPDIDPEAAAPIVVPPEGTVATPEPKPPVPETAAPADEKPEAPGTPVPDAKPDKAEPDKTEPDKAQADKPREVQGPPRPPEPVDVIEPEDAAAFEQCSKALTAIGAKFKPLPRIDDGHGCGIDKPISVTRILPGVDLAPEGTMRCETALHLAEWLKTIVIPAAELALPDRGKLTAFNQASTYICRKRNGAETGKISEHARGNAIDIASLRFEKGDMPMAIVTQEDSSMDAAFQRSLNATACLSFSTVLSPGSDAAHQDHMHLDVLARKGGYRFCR
ncbi:extensin [Agrobacterium sp. a22-2]|uniref:extensin-like domain-containing protein n=1 Tax=Agrobacterium sp. a22-2 TaxID=2283840 RepID=UPI00144684A1|nr:extensin family protein [Agrobacterium sp. a22-2]NKN39823.1 extensin [Agrobacterium sp. a22-2]